MFTHPPCTPVPAPESKSNKRKLPKPTNLIPTPLPESWLPLLKDRPIRSIYPMGDKTCLLALDHLLIIDANSKEKSIAEHKLPEACQNAVPWSDDVLILNGDTKIMTFDLRTAAFTKVAKRKNGYAVVGKMKSDNDDVLILAGNHATYFYLANDLTKLKRIESAHFFVDGYDGVVSADGRQYFMKTRTNGKYMIASFKDGVLQQSEIDIAGLRRDSVCAARKGGFVYLDTVEKNDIRLLDDKFNTTSFATPYLCGLNFDDVIVLPDQKSVLIVPVHEDRLHVEKFKEKVKAGEDDKLESMFFKLPGGALHLALDADNARLFVYSSWDMELQIFEDFQPLLEHRETVRKQFDDTRSAVALGMFANRQTNVAMPLVDVVMGYASRQRP